MMEIKKGKKYKCRDQRYTAQINYWDNAFGCWSGLVLSPFDCPRRKYWFKQGRGSAYYEDCFDLVEEIRETRTFYAVEYCYIDQPNFLGMLVPEAEKDRLESSHRRRDADFKRIIKLVEVLED